jgi:hypothetical protein
VRRCAASWPSNPTRPAGQHLAQLACARNWLRPDAATSPGRCSARPTGGAAIINAALNRFLATTIIENGQFIPRALRRLSLRPEEAEHAMRVQNGDDGTEIGTGRMEPNGQLILSLKPDGQNATTGDITRLSARLEAIEAVLAMLAAPR